MKLLLIGPPGSGKGTISEYLIKKHNFIHFSTGNLFRNIMNDNSSELAKEIKQYILNGLLVPDNLTNQLVKQELLASDTNSSYVFDGYPRSIEQSLFFDQIVSLDLVIFLDIEQELLIKRLTGRRICSKCKNIYNIYFNPPKIDNLCDEDNSLLVQRSDDQLSVIKERLKTYESTTHPLIVHFENKKILKKVNSNLSKQKVYEEIDKILLKCV